MNDETDSPQAGESLTIDQAAAAYVKATATKEVPTDQPKADEEDESDTPTDDIEQASDEDVSEEGDGETEPDDQPQEEDDEEPDSEKGRYVAHNGRVKLPDGSESTIADLISGNMKERDYRQKTQEVAEVRKTATAQSEALKASQKQADEFAAYAVSLVKSIIPPEPSYDLLDENSPNYDPAKHIRQEADFKRWAQHLNYLEQEQQRTATERQAETSKETTERLNREWAMALEKLPELKDAKRLEAFGKDTLKYGAEYGYSPQELANIHSDHRNLVVMKKAIAWDKLQASKPKVQQKVENRPPVQRGGKRLSPNDARARSASDAFNRLKQSGSVEDAAAAYIASHPRKG